MEACLSTLKKDLEHLASRQQSRLFMVIHDAPLILLSRYPMLAGFALFFSCVIGKKEEELKAHYFGSKFMEHEKVRRWLDVCRKSAEAYAATESEEYWSPFMFRHFLAKVKMIKRQKYFESPDIPDKIERDLLQLISDMEQSIVNGRKPDVDGQMSGTIIAFNHEDILNETALIAVDANIQFAYIKQSLMHMYRFSGRMAIIHHQQVIQYKDMWIELGKRSQESTRFFEHMRCNVKSILREGVLDYN